MKRYTLLGLNHRLRIPIPQYGGVMVYRREFRQTRVQIEVDDACSIIIEPSTLDAIDSSSSTMFPLEIEIYNVNEALLGTNLMANTPSAAMEAIAKSLRATGKEITPAVIEDALDSMVRKFPKPSSAYMTSKEKRGAARMWTGFMADLLCAMVADKKLEITTHRWSPPGAEAAR